MNFGGLQAGSALKEREEEEEAQQAIKKSGRPPKVRQRLKSPNIRLHVSCKSFNDLFIIVLLALRFSPSLVLSANASSNVSPRVLARGCTEPLMRLPNARAVLDGGGEGGREE